MGNKRGKWTIDQLVEMDACPCEVCSSQDDEETILKREELRQLDETCDLFANEMIDYLLENPSKYLLKPKNKQGNVK